MVQDSGFRVQEIANSGQQTADNIHPSSFIPHPSSPGLQPIAGFRVRLLETEGHHTQLGLRSFRQVASAKKIDSNNTSPIELSTKGDRIDIPIGPYQLIDVEAMFYTPGMNAGSKQ